MKKQELLDRILKLEKRIEKLEANPFITLTPTQPTDRTSYDCGCPLNYICNNTACPRAVKITTFFNTDSTAKAEDNKSFTILPGEVI